MIRRTRKFQAQKIELGNFQSPEARIIQSFSIPQLHLLLTFLTPSFNLKAFNLMNPFASVWSYPPSLSMLAISLLYSDFGDSRPVTKAFPLYSAMYTLPSTSSWLLLTAAIKNSISGLNQK